MTIFAERLTTYILLIATCIFMAEGAIAAPSSGDQLSAKTLTQDGKTLIVIGNPYLEMTFEPDQGGRCVSFSFLDTGEQVIGKDAVSGMFIDHWSKFTWPSGLMWLPYEYRIVGDGKSRIGVQLWITVPETGGGKGAENPESNNIPTSPDLAGLIVKKTVWLNADDNVIAVEQEIENPTAESRSVAPYIQHNLYLGGARLHNNWYLPSGQGVAVNIQPDQEDGRAVGPNWVLDPTAGWMAVRNRQTNRGMVFIFDYNYIQKLYTCGNTAEWFMETVPLAPGKSFHYGYIIKPVEGFEDFVYASENLIADIRPDEIGKRVRVNHFVTAASKPLTEVEVEFTVVGWRSKETIANKKIPVGNVGLDKVLSEFEFEPERLADGVVIKAVVHGTGFEERYEYYYAGDEDEYERRYNPFATQGQALPGTRGDAYYVKPPRKKKVFNKPDLSQISVASLQDKQVRCLVIFGLYTHILNIDDALEDWRKVDFTWADCPPNAVEWFPGTYEELFSYNTVVLSGVNYRAIGDIGFEMIRDYVEHGGRLLVTGGPYAFGNGEFEDTRFLDVLPVELSGPFDLKWAGKGRSWKLEPASEHRMLEAISFSQVPRVFWCHEVIPKPNTEVILKAGGKPTLIVGRYGKGKVAVLTLSPTGVGVEEEKAWWEWDGWFPLIRNIFSWLNAPNT